MRISTRFLLLAVTLVAASATPARGEQPLWGEHLRLARLVDAAAADDGAVGRVTLDG